MQCSPLSGMHNIPKMFKFEFPIASKGEPARARPRQSGRNESFAVVLDALCRAAGEQGAMTWNHS